METIGSRIKAARKAKKMTQKDLSDSAEVSATSIVYWERDEIEPKSKNLASLARALDCAPDFLMYGATFGEEVSIAQFHSRVPLIKWASVQKSKGGPMSKEVDVLDWLYCPVQCGKNTFALKVDSDSMVSPDPRAKSYPTGTIIFVDPDAEISNGSRVVARKSTSTEATFKEYIKDGGDNYLKPINPQYPTVQMDSDTVIIGVVIGSFSAE